MLIEALKAESAIKGIHQNRKQIGF
jgi:hypothetical protein